MIKVFSHNCKFLLYRRKGNTWFLSDRCLPEYLRKLFFAKISFLLVLTAPFSRDPKVINKVGLI